MFCWSWIFLFILLCPPCFGAEDAGCTERTIIVTARDTNGRASTLQVADLRGKINDKPMQILAATKPTNPTRIALVLDASASMAGKWQRLVESAVKIVQESPGSTEFALVIFADRELRAMGFVTGPEMVNDIMSFKNVRPAGHTGLRDAIWRAVSMFEVTREGDAIVVISDGDDNQSKVSPRQLREGMWSRGIRLMFVQVVDRYLPSSQFQDRDDADAARLSESSGGFRFPIENPNTLSDAAEEIASDIENYLALRITLPAALEKEASVHLEAVDASGRKRKNVELGFPEKLLPCARISSTQ
jgi:von Willebrand factor type A domain